MTDPGALPDGSRVPTPFGRHPRPPELVAFCAAFALFALMCAPGVEWRDAGELSAAAWTLGGSHPPGQPAHALLGKLAALLPVGEVAFRINLLSAAAMAAVVAGVLALARALVPGETVAAIGAAALVALSPVAQENATRAEVYGPATALIVWAAVAALRFVRAAPAERDGRLLLLAGFGCALAAAFHPLIAAAGALAPAIALGVAARRRLLRLGPLLLALGLLALACYLYLPVRAHAADAPPLMWGEPTTPGAFLDVVAGAPYRGNFAVDGIGGRFAGLALLAGEGSGLPLLLVGLLGLALGALTGLRGAGMLLGGAVVVLLAAATQARLNPDMPGYVLPALCFLAAGLAAAIGAAMRILPPALAGTGAPRRALVAAALMLPVAGLGLSGTTARASDGGFRRADHPLRLWADTVARMPPGPGVYLADGDDTLFLAWYERWVAGGRPDVAIANAELCRDSWFMVQLDRGLPELYVPFADDGIRGRGLCDRMVAENQRAGRPAGGDDWRGRGEATPMGRGYIYMGGVPDAPAPPPDFAGGTGGRVAGKIALTRALYEAASGRLAAAAHAAGIEHRFDAAALAHLGQARIDVERAPLWPFVPRTTPYHVHAPWLMDLLADELAWVAGFADGPPPGDSAPRERRIHALWRRALEEAGAGPLPPAAVDELAAWGRDAELATTTMLFAANRLAAAEALLRALLARGEDAELHRRLGRILELTGRTDEARAEFARALALDPELDYP